MDGLHFAHLIADAYIHSPVFAYIWEMLVYGGASS